MNTRETKSKSVARELVEKSSSVPLGRASEADTQNVTTVSEAVSIQVASRKCTETSPFREWKRRASLLRGYRAPISCKINFDATLLQFDYVDDRGRYIRYRQGEKNRVTPDLESKEKTKPVLLRRRLLTFQPKRTP